MGVPPQPRPLPPHALPPEPQLQPTPSSLSPDGSLCFGTGAQFAPRQQQQQPPPHHAYAPLHHASQGQQGQQQPSSALQHAQPPRPSQPSQFLPPRQPAPSEEVPVRRVLISSDALTGQLTGQHGGTTNVTPSHGGLRIWAPCLECRTTEEAIANANATSSSAVQYDDDDDDEMLRDCARLADPSGNSRSQNLRQGERGSSGPLRPCCANRLVGTWEGLGRRPPPHAQWVALPVAGRDPIAMIRESLCTRDSLWT